MAYYLAHGHEIPQPRRCCPASRRCSNSTRHARRGYNTRRT